MDDDIECGRKPREEEPPRGGPELYRYYADAGMDLEGQGVITVLLGGSLRRARRVDPSYEEGALRAFVAVEAALWRTGRRTLYEAVGRRIAEYVTDGDDIATLGRAYLRGDLALDPETARRVGARTLAELPWALGWLPGTETSKPFQVIKEAVEWACTHQPSWAVYRALQERFVRELKAVVFARKRNWELFRKGIEDETISDIGEIVCCLDEISLATSDQELLPEITDMIIDHLESNVGYSVVNREELHIVIDTAVTHYFNARYNVDGGLPRGDCARIASDLVRQVERTREALARMANYPRT